MSNEINYTPEQAAAKEEFCRRRGDYKWKSSSLWDDILSYDYRLISGYADYSSIPFERGAISLVMCELIAIVIDSSITHLHQAGLRNHIGHALEVGATEEQVIAALEISCTLGARTFRDGFGTYAEALKARGQYDAIADAANKDEQAAARAFFVKDGKDYWDEGLDAALALDPQGAKAFGGWNAAALNNDCLSQKDKELLWVALYASPTTCDKEGIREHINKALDCGATHEEIISVLELVSVIAVHSLTVSTPILRKQAEDYKSGNMWRPEERE